MILADLLGKRRLLQRVQKVMVCDWWISIRFVSFCISSHVIVIMIDGSHSRPLATRLNCNDHVTKNRRVLGTRMDGSEERIRPFPSSKKSHFQSEAKCEAIDMKMIFNYDANKNHFHNKGFALSLLLKVRFFGTRKWPVKVASELQSLRVFEKRSKSNIVNFRIFVYWECKSIQNFEFI